MIILGVSAYHGDCSASIIKDGKLIAAVEEERFTRIKHWAGFPANSISYCLKEARVDLKEVDYISAARDTKANVANKIGYVLSNPSSWRIVGDRLKTKKRFETLENVFAEKFDIDPELIKAKIKNVEHHKAHLASAYLVSSFNEAALISIDGFGDFVSAMYGMGKANTIDVFKKVYYPHSIGVFYTMITQFLGFKKYGDEYKVMGLASFGKPEYLKKMEDIISYEGVGNYRLNMKYFRHNKIKVDFNWESGKPDIMDLYSDAFIEKFGKPRDYDEPVTDFHKNFASSMQKHAEYLIFEIMKYVYDKTNTDKLSFAGGVAMNSVANGKIFRNTPFKEVYIPPVAGDAGISMGAAFYIWNQLLGKEKLFVLEHGYWGPEYDAEEIRKTLKRYESKLTDDEFQIETINSDTELINKTVDFICEGNVVGWFQGRMEFGARALGNRSIIVDPRKTEMKDILNARIKKREKFRPFAPSILIERVAEWFEENYPVPFMEKVYDIREEKKKLIPAVTHVDGTGRLQTISEDCNPLYYRLIKRFEEKTDVPIVLNTSFNENEPIVCTPQEALEAFLRTKMDVVVLGNKLIKRKK